MKDNLHFVLACFIHLIGLPFNLLRRYLERDEGNDVWR